VIEGGHAGQKVFVNSILYIINNVLSCCKSKYPPFHMFRFNSKVSADVFVAALMSLVISTFTSITGKTRRLSRVSACVKCIFSVLWGFSRLLSDTCPLNATVKLFRAEVVVPDHSYPQTLDNVTSIPSLRAILTYCSHILSSYSQAELDIDVSGLLASQDPYCLLIVGKVCPHTYIVTSQQAYIHTLTPPPPTPGRAQVRG
jgi:hypothetical protein